jgi:hypothetical protein
MLVSFTRLYAFKDNGTGLMWDSMTQMMVEPILVERERAMGNPIGTTNVFGISEQQGESITPSNGLELSYVDCFFGSCRVEAFGF